MSQGAEHAPDVKALLLDVEGTTTPVSFVYEVLFPYARRHLRSYLTVSAGSAEVREAAALLTAEWSDDIAGGDSVPTRQPNARDPESLHDYLSWLMDHDRKSPGLKLIQGRIWDRGYQDGELRGQVFADVQSAFARWAAMGVAIGIYSSGSVLAQRLLFAHSDSGNIATLIDHYFDTSVGPKRAPESYERIASAFRLDPPEIAFISDVDAELEAARDAGCRVLMCVRPGNAATTSNVAPIVHSFDVLDAALGLATRRD